MFTLGDTFRKWFTRPEICFFTGDYILDVDEVKPSPKPMFRVAKNLSSKYPYSTSATRARISSW